MKQKIQKIIVLILITLIAIPSVFFYKPQKANAFMLFGFEIDMLELKEYILDPIAYLFINQMVSQMSKEAIKWINSDNFLGPGGGYIPGFITQPGVFLRNVGDTALGEYIGSIQPFLCSPFETDVRLWLETKYRSSSVKKNYCTLTEVGENVGDAYEKFIQNFDDGGWRRWVKITVNPDNNRYGSVVRADAEASFTIGDKKYGVDDDLARGFLDQKVTECVKKATETRLMEDGFHWVDGIGRDLGKVIPGVEPPCVLSEDKTITPGTFLQTQVSEAIGDSKGRLRIADEIDELIGTLLSKLIMTGFDKLGLLGADIFDPGDGKKPFERTIDAIIAKTEEYISIKKVSLELTGKFEISGTQLGTPLPNQKIDWNGNDFEWKIGKYYIENFSSKIDWTGEPFAWENDKYYQKNPFLGVITGARCLTLEDTKLPDSYITNRGVLNPFWNTSKCLDFKDADGKHLEYNWGPTTPTVKRNALVKPEMVSCRPDSIGREGYTVTAENDGFWSTSICQEISTTTSAVDWKNSTKTNKDIYREITTKYFEKRLDWNGILFDWDDDGRAYNYDSYAPYIEEDNDVFVYNKYGQDGSFGQSHDDFADPESKILKIKSMATPPKICYPRDQRVAGVVEGQALGQERWTILACTKTPPDLLSKNFLEYFKSVQPVEREEHGVWTKINDNPRAKIIVVLEGPIFDNLLKNYGSVPIKDMFEDFLGCLNTKYGNDSTEVDEMNTKIYERKRKRLQIIADILLAEGMLENAKTLLEERFNNIGGLNYLTLVSELEELKKTLVVSDADISEAKDEWARIESENALISEQKKACEEKN